MKSMLEQDLLEFLPLSKASDSAQRRNLIFSAIDKLDKEYKNKNTLSQLEEELIRGFVAALVYEFVTDPDIYQNLQDFEGGYPTAPVENSQGIGFGISLRKASNIDCVRPFLEEVLDIVFSKNAFELIELKDVDRVVRSASSSAAQQNTLQKTINKLTNLPTLVGDFKVIAKRSSLNAYRLFLYIRPSFDIWARAMVNFLNSPYPKHFQINNILLNAALNIELNEQNRELFLDFIPYFDLNSRYIILGKLAQQDDKIIDWLMSQLPSAPPPESMRTVNALIIAAHRNKKAVEAYLEVKSNRHKYPDAVEEYALIGGYLDPANEEALASLLAEAVKPITERPSGVNDVPKPRSALQILNNLPALEPKALIYLIGVLSGSDSEIKSIASSLISRNREKLERGTNAKNMIEALLDVAATPIALIVDSGGGSNYLPFVKTLKEMVIITAVQVALDVQALDGGKLQITFLKQILSELIKIDDEFLNKLTTMEIPNEINAPASITEFIISKIFKGDEKQAHAIAEGLSENDEKRAALLIDYLYQNILHGQLACLAAIVLKYPDGPLFSFDESKPSKVHPEIEAVISSIRDENKEFFNDTLSPSLAPFEANYITNRNLMSELLEGLDEIDIADAGPTSSSEDASSRKKSFSNSDSSPIQEATMTVDKINVTLSISESGIHPFSGTIGNIRIMHSHSCGNDTGRLVQGSLEIGSKKFNLHGLRCTDCGALVLTVPELGPDNTFTRYEGIQSLRDLGAFDVILELLYKLYMTMSGGEKDKFGEFFDFDGTHYVWDPIGEAHARNLEAYLLAAPSPTILSPIWAVRSYIDRLTNKTMDVELRLSEDSSTVRYEGKVGRETIHQHNCVGDTARHIHGSMNLGDSKYYNYELEGKRCVRCGDMFLNAPSLGLGVETIWFNGISSINDINAETVLMAFILRDV